MTSPTLKACAYVNADSLAALEVCGAGSLYASLSPTKDEGVAIYTERPALPADEVRRIQELARKEWAGDKPIPDAEVRLLNWAVGFAINEALGNVAAGREGE